MKKTNYIADLQQSILLLEAKQANDGTLLKVQFKLVHESLNPIHLIENGLTKLTNLSDLKGNILGTSLSLIAGYFSKIKIIGSTHNPIKQILGSLLQVGVTSIVLKKSDDINSFATHIIANIFRKKKQFP